MAELFGNFQFEICMQGLSGSKPPFPIAYRDLEAKAKEVLKPEAFDYVAGRPYVWGLAVGGAEGVRQVLRSFLAELDLTVALAGYTRVTDIAPNALEWVERLG